MKICWAESLGACSSNYSGEHYVSKCAFETGNVSVQGFGWCKDAPKEISIENLTANILCTDHNTALSELDASAGKTFSTFRKASELFMTRSSLPHKRWTNKPTFNINGLRLERWMLKTLVNFCVRGKNIIGINGDVAGNCPPYLAEIAFGLRPFEKSSGLYSVSYVGQAIDLPKGTVFQMLTILFGEDRVVAGIFSLNGFLFMLWLLTDTEPHEISGPHVYGKDWEGLTFTRHLMQIDFKINERPGMRSHRVRFDWPNARV